MTEIETASDQEPLYSPRERYNINPDKVLDALGSFGLHQRVWYFLICLPCALCGFITLAATFTAAQPKFRCFVPNCDTENSTYQAAFRGGYANFSIPVEKSGHFSECLMYKQVNGEDFCSQDAFLDNVTIGCPQNQHIYDESVYKSTITSEFNLTCDNQWKVPLTESILFLTVLVSAPVFGYLADKIGRKHSLMIAISLMTIGGFCLSFAPTYEGYLSLQTIGAFGQLGVFQTAFILGVENVGKDYRVLCGVVIEYFFVLGEILLAVVAFEVREWRKILLFVMAPSTVFILYWKFVPESLRWLLSKHKYRSAQQLVNQMTRWNKKQSIKLEDMHEESIEEENRITFHNDTICFALKHKSFVWRGLNICFCWLVVSMTFYGLSLNATNLAGSPYLNFLLVSLAELPAYTLAYISMEKCGRRLSVSLALIIGGISIISDPFLPPNINWLKIVFFLIGKVGVTCAFATIYLYTTELYPTSLRTLGVGFSSMFGRIGAIISPYIGMLSQVQGWLPLFIFGISAVASGSFILFLPETLGRELPETLADALQTSPDPQENQSEPRDTLEQHSDMEEQIQSVEA